MDSAFPKAPRGEKRPADVIGAAVMVARIAMGEIEDPKAEKIHKTHRLTPAMAAGITDKLWSVEDIVASVDVSEPNPGKRGSYKKRIAA
jgi:hypothetical protein